MATNNVETVSKGHLTEQFLLGAGDVQPNTQIADPTINATLGEVTFTETVAANNPNYTGSVSPLNPTSDIPDITLMFRGAALENFEFKNGIENFNGNDVSWTEEIISRKTDGFEWEQTPAADASFKPSSEDKNEAPIAGEIIPDSDIATTYAVETPKAIEPIRTDIIEDGGIALSYERSDEAFKMQENLIALGYDVGPLDGIPGPLTMAALEEYQADHPEELINTTPGYADASTLAQLERQASILAPTPDAPESNVQLANQGLNVDSLIDFIYQYESSGDPNLIYGDRPFQGEHELTEMTIHEVRALQDELVADGSPSSAAGNLQVIRKTMDSLIEKMNLTGNELFDEQMQRDMTITLMEQRGLSDYQNGEINLDEFMENLSQEWASLPKDETGLSYYHGDGLNYSHASYADLKNILEGIQTAPDTSATMIADASDAIKDNAAPDTRQISWTAAAPAPTA